MELSEKQKHKTINMPVVRAACAQQAAVHFNFEVFCLLPSDGDAQCFIRGCKVRGRALAGLLPRSKTAQTEVLLRASRANGTKWSIAMTHSWVSSDNQWRGIIC